MEVKIELSKYDIIGIASLIGASQSNIEEIDKYVSENESLKLDCLKEGDEGFKEFKTAISAIVVAQISETLNLK